LLPLLLFLLLLLLLLLLLVLLLLLLYRVILPHPPPAAGCLTHCWRRQARAKVHLLAWFAHSRLRLLS
jgi:hypothetical protein